LRKHYLPKAHEGKRRKNHKLRGKHTDLFLENLPAALQPVQFFLTVPSAAGTGDNSHANLSPPRFRHIEKYPKQAYLL
jgi:hypothetical protein